MSLPNHTKITPPKEKSYKQTQGRNRNLRKQKSYPQHSFSLGLTSCKQPVWAVYPVVTSVLPVSPLSLLGILHHGQLERELLSAPINEPKIPNLIKERKEPLQLMTKREYNTETLPFLSTEMQVASSVSP